jgi:hypothetical protein
MPCAIDVLWAMRPCLAGSAPCRFPSLGLYTSSWYIEEPPSTTISRRATASTARLGALATAYRRGHHNTGQ